MSKLHTLVKAIKDFSIQHSWVEHLKYQILLWITKYILGIEKLSDLALNKIYRQCIIA